MHSVYHPEQGARARFTKYLTIYRRVTNIRISAHFNHLRKFRNFVFATEVTIFSYHNPLVYLRECAPKSAKLTRWALGFKNSCMLILIFFTRVYYKIILRLSTCNSDLQLTRFFLGTSYDTIRYETRCYFHLQSKADMSKLLGLTYEY